MNPIALYVSTCRLVLQARESDPSTWSDLRRLIPEFCASLSCSACSQLASDPLSPVNPENGKEILLCSKCVSDTNEEHAKFTPNNTVRILILCFKKLCEYIVSSPLIRYLDGNESLSNVVEILLQSVGNDFKLPESISKTANDEMYIGSADLVANGNTNSVCEDNDVFAGVIFAEKYKTKVSVKKRPVGIGHVESKRSKLPQDGCRTRNVKPKSVLKKGCRCGNATLTPGKLTCCGQRCPCYVSSKSCVECRCKGCRNPHNNCANNVNNNDCGLNSSDVEVL